MMRALASAGTFTPSFTDMVTLTSVARGSIESIGADRNADDADVVTRVQADRRGEVADDLVPGARRPHQVHADEQRGHQQRGQRDPQPPAAREGRIGVCHGDFGLTISRSEIYPRSYVGEAVRQLAGLEVEVQQDFGGAWRRQAVQVDLEAGAGPDHLAERGRVRRQPAQGLADVLLALEQVVHHRVQLVQRRLELAPVVGDEAGKLLRDIVDAGDQVAQRLTALIERGEQQVAVGDQLVHLTGTLRQACR